MRFPLWRYLIEAVLLLALAIVVFLYGLPALGVETSAALRPALTTLALLLVTELMVFRLVQRGLSRDTDRFMIWWGLSFGMKFVLVGAVVATSLKLVPGLRDLVLLFWMGSFLLLSFHQTVRLLQEADATDPMICPRGDLDAAASVR